MFPWFVCCVCLLWTSCLSMDPMAPNGAKTNQSDDTMLELYKLLRNTEDPSLTEVEAIKKSDTIRSYTGHIVDGHFYMENARKWRVVFPTINEFVDELLLAELHVKVATTTASDQLVGLDANHMLSFPCDSTTATPVCRRRKLIQSLETTKYVNSEESAVIDFTEEMRKWFAEDGTVSRMVELWSYGGTEEDLRRTDGDQGRQRMAKLLSGRGFLSSDVGDSTEEEGSPPAVDLIVYTRAADEQSIVHDRISLSSGAGASRHRIRRSGGRDEERSGRRRDKKERQLRKERREELARAREEKLAREAAADSGPCRVVEMGVDFEEIGWSKWILYPKSFNAKRCSGRCSGPLDAIHNPSNHAVMQDLIRLRIPGRAPEPCCIPTKLQPLSMLYVEEGIVVVRHHEEMVTEQCGCR